MKKTMYMATLKDVYSSVIIVVTACDNNKVK